MSYAQSWEFLSSRSDLVNLGNQRVPPRQISEAPDHPSLYKLHSHWRAISAFRFGDGNALQLLSFAKEHAKDALVLFNRLERIAFLRQWGALHLRLVCKPKI